MVGEEEGRGRRRMEASARACFTGNLLFVIHRGQGEHLEMGDRVSQSEVPTLSPRATVRVILIFSRIQQGRRRKRRIPMLAQPVG